MSEKFKTLGNWEELASDLAALCKKHGLGIAHFLHPEDKDAVIGFIVAVKENMTYAEFRQGTVDEKAIFFDKPH
jgi:hypothetical protein